MRKAFLTILRVNAYLSVVGALWYIYALVTTEPPREALRLSGGVIAFLCLLAMAGGAIAFIVWMGIAEWAKAAFETHDEVHRQKAAGMSATDPTPMLKEALAKLKEIQVSVDDPTDIKQIIESQAQLDRLTNGLADVLGEIISRLETIEGKLNKPG